MLDEWTTLWSASWQLTGGFPVRSGGRRFRRGAVEARAGIPHFPDRVETLFLGLVYSGPIASAIVSIEPDATQWPAARTEPAADAVLQTHERPG